ncbi:3-keto-disaccharide hydrolase [Aporhodopirellula aestuarii]|uniref:DUF1080 domain-containing protein n=1 Tax=Aporhodopirellula aestuarii TaxID=2950107 RepID=A0ABT0TX33_9BACT|nr:DUF1080 domain-containing protein [Aporhodopirellula aestuarii]MCM2369162.1 DUF1080 domain-containing protein [Aporhodopirellula aestuarii]
MKTSFSILACLLLIVLVGDFALGAEAVVDRHPNNSDNGGLAVDKAIRASGRDVAGRFAGSKNLMPLLVATGNIQPRALLVQQAGSTQEVMYRPAEKRQFNAIHSPEQKLRVEKMRNEYMEVLNSRGRTTHQLVQAKATKANAGKPENETPIWTDAKTAAKEFPGFALLGEYVRGDDAIQVVPCEGQYYLSIYRGGLPGAGWDRGKILHEWLDANAVKQRLKGFRKVDRSASLDFPEPPSNAIVLFDGSGKEHWAFGKVENGLLQAGAKTKREFQDFRLHFECSIPLKPELPLAHPGRGNSGVFAVGAYEVQVCDTFGVDFAPDRWEIDRVMKHPDTWCGAIYGIRAPDTNMCLPPLSWQSFDIEFTAARFEDGMKVTDARMTVHQNGMLIHDDVPLPEGTGGGPSGPRAEVPRGPIYVQSHGNPVQYRNIWVTEN